jgi:hypothetical protein
MRGAWILALEPRFWRRHRRARVGNSATGVFDRQHHRCGTLPRRESRRCVSSRGSPTRRFRDRQTFFRRRGVAERSVRCGRFGVPRPLIFSVCSSQHAERSSCATQPTRVTHVTGKRRVDEWISVQVGGKISEPFAHWLGVRKDRRSGTHFINLNALAKGSSMVVASVYRSRRPVLVDRVLAGVMGCAGAGARAGDRRRVRHPAGHAGVEGRHRQGQGIIMPDKPLKQSGGDLHRGRRLRFQLSAWRGLLHSARAQLQCTNLGAKGSAAALPGTDPAIPVRTEAATSCGTRRAFATATAACARYSGNAGGSCARMGRAAGHSMRTRRGPVTAGRVWGR